VCLCVLPFAHQRVMVSEQTGCNLLICPDSNGIGDWLGFLTRIVLLIKMSEQIANLLT